MALYLLDKTAFHSSEKNVINGRSIYEYYPKISAILQQHCPVIYLAEPIITNKDAENSFISWYADTKNEPVLPLDTQQEFINKNLSEALSTLSQLYAQDSSERLLLNVALSVESKQDILIADNQIVLKGWGRKISSDQSSSGLSLFSLFMPQIPQIKKHQPEQSVSPSSEKATNIPNQDVNKIFKKRPIRIMGGMPRFLMRLFTAILFFVIGILLGWRIIYAERPTKIAKIPVIEAQDLVHKKPDVQKDNKALEDEIKKLEEQLKNPPCDLEKSRAAPELNKSIDNPFTPMKSNGKNFQGSLPELLEKSTVFVLVKTKDGDGDDAIASGSGFFITPDLIVTNRHVVEGADNNVVLVTNKALGQLKKAHIVSISDRSEDVNDFDLAVLKIEDTPPQQPLSFTLEAQPLQTVVAAGYPGIIIRQDGALKRLVKGDITSIPGVVLTKGDINAIQENAKGEKIIPHSAAVSPGNSGGELVDLCGRVVGVNTFVTMDSETSSHSNYAQKSDSIIKALQAANIPIQVQTGTCKDNVSDSSGGENKTGTSNQQEQQGSPTTKADPKKDNSQDNGNSQPSTSSEKKPDQSSSHGDKP